MFPSELLSWVAVLLIYKAPSIAEVPFLELDKVQERRQIQLKYLSKLKC